MKAIGRLPVILILTKLLLFYIIPVTYCQATKEIKEPEKSKIKSFSLKKGCLIKKDFKTLGYVKKVEVQALKLTDVLTGATVSGIQLKPGGRPEKAAFLDADEVDGFLRSGKYLLNSLKPAKNYVEYEFTSRHGFQAGVHQNKEEFSYFLKLERYDNDSYVFLDQDDFEQLIEMVENAKVKKEDK
jgi:hypothetical protein